MKNFIVFVFVLAVLSLQAQHLIYKPDGHNQVKTIDGLYHDSLKVKLYLPETASEALPVVVFINGGGGDYTTWQPYIEWPKAIAGAGMIGLAYETDQGQGYQQTNQLLNWLSSTNISPLINRERVMLWMCSSNGLEECVY